MTIPAGWESLLTCEGLTRVAEAEELLVQGASALQANTTLRRRGAAAAEAAAALTQAELRRRARSKFDAELIAAGLLFTQAGLEQATRARVAAMHASRFTAAGCDSVADLGCGIGAESLALLTAGIAVHPVERDPFTARLAEHNLAVAAQLTGLPAPQVRIADAEHLDAELWSTSGINGVFLDPARRTAGHGETTRLTSPQDYSPSLDFAFELAARMPTGVKLGPGFDRDLIPQHAEAQWVSADGQLVETGLWFGEAARRGVGRSALVLDRAGGSAELAAETDAADAPVRGLGEYLYEPDGAVIRARLIGRLAEEIGAGMLSDGIAYLSSDRPVESPFATAFRVLEELPVRQRDLKRELASRDIGSLEIKKRGADVDPAALRRRLRLRGSASATLFLTRADGKHIALLAERC